MSSGFRATSLLLGLCSGLLLNLPSLAVYGGGGANYATLDRLERTRFGHTNYDIRLKERIDVLEWSVMGGRQYGSLSERLAAIEQKLDAEGAAASINDIPTYNQYRPRTGYLAGRHRIQKTRTRVIVVAARTPNAPAASKKTYNKVKIIGRPRVVASAPKARTASPQVVTGLIKKGNELYMAGDYRKSVNELTRAIELNPSYAPSYVCRGYAYAKLGDADKEKSDFKLAKKLDSHIQLPM